MSETKKVKIVCVGVGGYGEVYMRDFFSDNDPIFEFVGAVDPYAEKSKFYENIKANNIPIYNDMEEFYKNSEADLAVISTPIHFHTRQILTALSHGSNVICEKPLSGISTDEEIIERAAKEAGKFVMIGYQWSYSKPILDLKADVMSGLLGKPQFLKTIILWPRKKEYFARGTGWAGRLTAKDGTVINDSIAANACAHYIHNILFVCGEEGLASEAKNIKADLIRVNDIENFDNACIKFELDSGAECLFLAAHSSSINSNPAFEYRFENATVTYSEDTKDIVAYFKNGEEKHYGNPFAGRGAEKAYIAMRGCGDENFKPACTHRTAAAHTRFIEEVQKTEIKNVNPALIRENGTLLYVEGLTEAMRKCYADEVMLRDIEFYGELVK